jgi:hypothetical protein
VTIAADDGGLAGADDFEFGEEFVVGEDRAEFAVEEFLDGEGAEWADESAAGADFAGDSGALVAAPAGFPAGVDAAREFAGFSFEAPVFAELAFATPSFTDLGIELGAGERVAEEAGAEELGERSNRGTTRMARSTAAAALTRKSLLEREEVGSGAGTRRELPMVAFTWGSEETGMGEAFGETGERGTASGSICGSGSRCATRVERDADGLVAAEAAPACAAARIDSGESGASGGRT